MKKTVSILLALLLLLGLSTSTFAAGVPGFEVYEDDSPLVIPDGVFVDEILEPRTRAVARPTAKWNFNDGSYYGTLTMSSGGWANYLFQANGEGKIYVKATSSWASGSSSSQYPRFILQNTNGANLATFNGSICPGSNSFSFYNLTPWQYYAIRIEKNVSGGNSMKVSFQVANYSI